MKLKKKSDLVIIIVSLIVIGINNISFSKYDNYIKCDYHSQIAKAIIDIEKDKKTEENIEESKLPMEYNFSINNYKDDCINEIEFDYSIEIIASNDKFPISYKLYDVDSNSEISLINGKSETLRLAKKVKISRKFKLILEWKEIDGELSDEIKINLKVNAVQSWDGEKNEN